MTYILQKNVSLRPFVHVKKSFFTLVAMSSIQLVDLIAADSLESDWMNRDPRATSAPIGQLMSIYITVYIFIANSSYFRKNISIPYASTVEGSSDTVGRYSKCEMYYVNYTEILNSGIRTPNTSWPKTSCRHGWTFDYTNIPYASIAAEVGLEHELYYIPKQRMNFRKTIKEPLIFQLEWVCDIEYYSSVAQSVFYIGSIVGGFIFGYMADNYGRVPALVACNGVGFIASIATAFCNSFWSFCLCRFIVGTAFDNCFNIIFIIGRYRVLCTVVKMLDCRIILQ